MRSPRITEHPTDMTVARNDPVTLKCSADGSPAPTIEWYRDGELIISSNGQQQQHSKSGGGGGGGNSHRVMLPGGDLFFFRVVHGRKESDAGLYWCLARNPQGSSRSRNATLTVACKCSVESHFQFILCWFFPSFFLHFIPACYHREKWAIAHLLLDKLFIVNSSCIWGGGMS
jgi:hypothetical protein